MDDVTINKLKGRGDSPLDTDTQVVIGGVEAGAQADGAVERALTGDAPLGVHDESYPAPPEVDGEGMIDHGSETASDVGESLLEGLSGPFESLDDPTSFFAPDEGSASSAIAAETFPELDMGPGDDAILEVAPDDLDLD